MKNVNIVTFFRIRQSIDDPRRKKVFSILTRDRSGSVRNIGWRKDRLDKL